MTIDSLEKWCEEQDAIEEKSGKDMCMLKNFERAKEGFETFKGEDKVDMLWRMSRAAFKAAAHYDVAGDKKNQKAMLLEAENYGLKAIELSKDAPNVDAHSWFAYVLGKLSDHVGVNQRLEKGKQVMVNLDTAIAIKPHYVLHYTYGRWALEVSKLSWFEKKIAATFFEKPPEATIQDALDQFMKSYALKPDYKSNCYWIGKCHVQLKNYKDAIKFFDEAAKHPVIDEEDEMTEKTLGADIAKYSSYRS